jgi:phage terminase large subunit-like protein
MSSSTASLKPRSKKPRGESDQYYFDETAADIACAFFERLLLHSKGEWAGKPFTLLPWQRDNVIRPLFGWKRRDGTRKYRRAYIEVAKKNGKSELGSGIALYCLLADGEEAAEVYSAASDREQAAIVFETAKHMVEDAPALSKRCEIYRRAITVPSTRSYYRVLSADVPSKHGPNVHALIFDELHTQANRDLWDTLTAGTASRRQPLIVALTTAGFDRKSICWEQHEYARKVLAGIIVDPEFLAVICAAEAKDDWLNPKTWAKANPSLGVTVSEDFLRGEAARAREVPAYQNTFRRLHLSQWVSQITRWMPMDIWDRCNGPVDPQALRGRPCYGGLDLASSSDLAAFLVVFPPTAEDPLYSAMARFWIPEENMEQRVRSAGVPYDAWVRQGFIKATEGNVIDYVTIGADILELSTAYGFQEVAFDRWGAIQMSQQLTDEGFTMVDFGQGFVSMSPPTKELLRLVLDRKFAHGGNPVLRWMADNVAVRTDPAGNIKPDRQRSTEKIDGIVALIMALDRALRHGQGDPGSVYETRGLTIL